MKLQSGTSLWESEKGKPKTYESLREDISCDVLIVGSGILGALLAYKLSKENKKLSVVLIEKNEVGAGSTTASTALLMYGLDANLIDLARMIGKEKAVRIYKSSLESVIEIKKIIRKLGLNCDHRDKKTIYFASRPKDAEFLKKEYETLKENGFKVEYLSRKELQKKFSIDKEAAILRHEGAEVNPYKLTRELLYQAEKNGIKIYEHTETAIENKNLQKNCEESVKTKDGYAIKTCNIVFATGYESKNYINEELVDLTNSYIIATPPLPHLSDHWLEKHMVWETKRPYLYIRTTCDQRVIIGGEDEKNADEILRNKLIPEKSEKLKNKFEKLIINFPISIEHAWAGTFGNTKDGLGYVGVPKGYENVYFSLGFGGNGITFGVIAANILSKILSGEKHKDYDLFSFER